jgi:hypothetical protein
VQQCGEEEEEESAECGEEKKVLSAEVLGGRKY